MGKTNIKSKKSTQNSKYHEKLKEEGENSLKNNKETMKLDASRARQRERRLRREVEKEFEQILAESKLDQNDRVQREKIIKELRAEKIEI